MSDHKLPIAEQLKIATRISTENAINLDKGIVGQYNGTFPLTVANVGNVYYDPQTNKYYKCLVEYNGESIPSPTTDKFKEISITELENNKFEKGVTPTSLPNAEAIYKALQANVGIKFDENLLYLNDDGTKKLGFCYLDKLSDGIFECIKETNTKVNDSACFKNFSSKENSDRLGNLFNLDYDKIQNLNIGINMYQKYIIEQNGIIFYQLHGFNKRTAFFKINGILISTAYYSTDTGSELISSNLIVNKNDVIEYKTEYFPTVENSESFVRFVPFK